MNLSELASFVCGKVGLSETNDIAACKKFLNQRYELVWNEGLWRDALVMIEQTVDPDTDENAAAGIVLLPAEIDRVIAARTENNSLRVNGLEFYHRIDFDKFQGTGTALEFAVLSPVWTIWRGAVGLQVTSAAADDGKTIIVQWRDSDGVKHTDTLTLNTAQPPEITPTMETTIENQNRLVVTEADDQDAWGTYTKGGDPAFPTRYHAPAVSGGVPHYIYYDSGTALWRLEDNGGNILANSQSLIGAWDSTVGVQPFPTVAYGYSVEITIESVFKPVTTGDITFAAQYADETAAGTIANTATRSDVCQRLRLFEKPTKSATLRILGKRKFVQLTEDYMSPELQNVDNVLIALAHADMLQRMRQYGKAQVIAQEAGALLGQLKQVEMVQQATNTRIVPDDGFQPDYIQGHGRFY